MKSFTILVIEAVLLSDKGAPVGTVLGGKTGRQREE